jgi:hypothetical protein
MGTPVAVTYANLVLFTIEAPLIAQVRPLYFKRYIDDIFGLFDSVAQAMEFFRRFNEACPAIQLEAITVGPTGVMLDLQFTISHSPDGRTLLHHTLYQKPANKYQYIPLLSEHSPAVFRNFISAELRRYLLSCSKYVDFVCICSAFRARLRARGYHDEILDFCIGGLPPRGDLVARLPPPSNYLNVTPNPHYTISPNPSPTTPSFSPNPTSHPNPPILPTNPTSECTVHPNPSPRLSPPVIVMHVPRMRHPIRWHSLLALPPELLSAPEYRRVHTGNPIIGVKNPPSIARALTAALKPDDKHVNNRKRPRPV